MSDRREISRVVFEACLKVRPGEKVLILTDRNKEHLARPLYDFGKTITDTVLQIIPVTRFDGDEPGREITELCQGFDVILAPTTMSVSHTSAMVEARRKGARVATMPGITDEIFDTALLTDYRALSEKTVRLQRQMNSARELYVTAPGGTDVRFSVEGREFFALDGCCHAPGAFVNLPDGEVMVAPVEESINGCLAFDLSLMPDHLTDFGIIGLLTKEKVIVEVESGRIKSIKGGKKAGVFRDVLAAADERASVVAEFAMGTNPAAVIIGNILMDEKVDGTVHFAFGSNVSFGGKNQSNVHLDGVISRPSVMADGVWIIKNGKLSR